MTSQTERILGLLAMYINAAGESRRSDSLSHRAQIGSQSPGVTARLQGLVFETLRSWLQAGELDATLIARSPLFAFAFDALGNIELFDHAVDVVCDLIHETQEVEDNVEVVQLIVPRVIALRDVFHQAVSSEEDDSVRGFCRIFTEAGETSNPTIE